MKRSSLRRNTPLKRSAPPKRGGWLKRTLLRKRPGVFGPLCDHVRGMPCVIEGCSWPSDPHHVLSRGAGWKDWLPDGIGNVAPLCRAHHTECEQIGRFTFADRYGIDLRNVAFWVGYRFKEQRAA